MSLTVVTSEQDQSDLRPVPVVKQLNQWSLRRCLIIATTVYLGLPVCIFLLGWLKPIWSVPCIVCAMLTMNAMMSWKGKLTGSTASEPLIKWWQVILFLLTLTMIVCVNGPGGVGVQNWDWVKHNAILRDLVDKPWPVKYITSKGEVGLTYYLAYYLPAAVVGKIAGWQAANVAICIWTVLGVFLAGLWTFALSGARWWLVLIVFILFSGMDILGVSVWGNFHEPHDWFNNFDAEWWPKFWAFPSHLTLIAYAPNQAIAGWLFSALLVDGFRNRPESYPLGGILVFSLLWSPFVTVGLSIIAGIQLLSRRAELIPWFKSQKRPYNLAAYPVATILIVYFLSRFASYELPASLYPSKKIIEMGGFYFTPSKVGFGGFSAVYLLTVLLEFGTLALLSILVLRKRPGTDNVLLIASLMVLLVIPWFHYGRYNDLVMRISIPALFVLQVMALKALSGPANETALNVKRRYQAAIVIVLLLGALYPINMLRITANRIEQRSWRIVYIPLHDQVPDLFEQQRQNKKLLFSIGQYIGSVDSMFYRNLARENSSSHSSEQAE